jgi:hypothetical protein
MNINERIGDEKLFAHNDDRFSAQTLRVETNYTENVNEKGSIVV